MSATWYSTLEKRIAYTAKWSCFLCHWYCFAVLHGCLRHDPLEISPWLQHWYPTPHKHIICIKMTGTWLKWRAPRNENEGKENDWDIRSTASHYHHCIGWAKAISLWSVHRALRCPEQKRLLFYYIKTQLMVRMSKEVTIRGGAFDTVVQENAI